MPPQAERTEVLLLGGSGLEEEQERRVLAQQILDLRDARARPVLDPRLGQVVLDVVESALVHVLMIGQEPGRDNGPDGSFRGEQWPTSGESPLWERKSGRRRFGGRGAPARDLRSRTGGR